MREKKSRRWLSLLLTVVMLLSLIPSAVFAANETESTFYRVFHLDCGRKYFSVTEIEGIVDKLAENNYTHLQLAFGNDALRFLLDDMTVGTYSDDEVTAAIQSANSTYSSNKSTEATALTEAEMDEIIAHADNAGIEIIPLLNTPGHMTVLLSAMKTLGVSSSTSFSLTDEAQVSFTQELVGKYITYFAGKGCTFFNMGADEYSFSSLDSTGYAAFVAYINNIADAIKAAGMEPVAFNDGIYYNSDDTAFANVAAGIDRDIIVAYWCQADGYASAATLAANSFSLLNNNSYWYYVLGDALYDVWAQGQWGYKDSKAALQATPCTTFDTSDSTGVAAIGSVMCVWCDYPKYAYDSDKVYDLIATMAASNPDYFVESGTPTDPDPEETENEDVVLTDDTTGIEVNFGTNKVTSMAVEALTEAPEIPGAREVLAYNITPNGYTGTAMVSIPVPTTWTNVRGGVMASESGEEVLDIEGTLSNGVFTFEAPHFSDVVVYDLAENSDEVTENETITVTVGETATATISGANYAGTYTTEDPSIATVEVTGTNGSEATVIYTKVTSNPNWNTLISSNTTSATSYYFLADDGEYYLLYATRSDGTWFRYNYSLGYYANGSSTLTSVASATNSWGNSAVSNVTLYTKSGTEATPASTTVTFTGVAVGTTYVTVGNTRYTINVTAEDLSNVTPLTVEFWLTNNRVSSVQSTSGPKYNMTISAETAYGEAGVEISPLVPEKAWKIYSWGVGEETCYWKSTVLGSSNKQTTAWGDNKTQDGTDFTRVRYWEKSWAVLDENGEWISVGSSDQVVAYYMQRFKVIDELTTLSVDWADTYAPNTEAGYNANQRIEGTNSDWNVNNWSALDFQVVYSGGAKNPTDDSFAVSGQTQIFHNGNAQGSGNTIGMIGAEIDPTYKITKIEILNVSNWTINGANNSASDYATLDIEYLESSATVVWDASDPQYAGTDPIVTSVTFGDINANNENDISGSCTPDTYRVNELNNATNCVLIRYYIEADPQYENLTVHYVNQDTGVEFHEYGISSVQIDEDGVAETKDTFTDQLKDGFTENADGSITGEPNTNVFILNTLDVEQPVYYLDDDFTKIDGMPSVYYTGLFTFAGSATVSADGLDIYFYYKTKDKAYDLVIDFGLPVEITAEALGVSSVSIENSKGLFGSITNNVYTPEKVLTGADTFSATVKVGDIETNALLNIVPASNVLYEDGFMTAETGDKVSWTGGGSKVNASGNKQTTGTSAEDSNVYGYDPAYNTEVATNPSGTQYVATVDATNNRTNALTFTFTGTGFDLIGACGPETGTLMVRVEDSKGNYVMGYLVDTSFNDSNVAEKLYQVPLVHAQDLPEASYKVTVRGAYFIYDTNTVSATSYNLGKTASNVDPDSVITDLDFTAEELDSVQYISVEESLSSTTYSSDAGVSATSLADPAPTEMTLEIDGFRVYRSTSTAYVTDEQGMKYVNVLDAVYGGFAGYIEGGNTEEEDFTQSNYESSGGPQNEIYLPANTAVYFHTNLNAGDTVQISARAVTGTAELMGDTDPKTITSKTEMYYTVTVGEDGVIAVTNSKDATGMLALGNLKVPVTTVFYEPTVASNAIAYTMLRSYAAALETPVFEPEILDVNIKSTGVSRNKLVTVVIVASPDVAKLTVNGRELRPANSRQVSAGWSQNYIYMFVDTMKRGSTKTYEIVAYDADGLASEAYTVQG